MLLKRHRTCSAAIYSTHKIKLDSRVSKKTLSALETLLTSAGRAGDIIVYISIQQVSLLYNFVFKVL